MPMLADAHISSLGYLWLQATVENIRDCDRKTLLTGRSFNPTLRQKILDAL